MKFFWAILFFCYGANIKALTFEEAKHLLNRSRFFYTQKDLKEFIKLDRLKAARLAIGGYKGNAPKEDAPPFPSAPTYDAKTWKFMREHASPGALFWNVGA